METEVRFTLNGKPAEVLADPLRRLIDVLRDDLGLTGTKEGCGEGECGACSVLVDGRLVNSCLVPLAAVAGRDIVTIEGFRKTSRFVLLKECFADEGAVQCGFCTPGLVLTATALTESGRKYSDEEIKREISGHLCRCTGYNKIFNAVKRALEAGH